MALELLEAPSVESALEQLARSPASAVVLDLATGQPDATVAVKRLRGTASNPLVLLLIDEDDAVEAGACLAAGASDWLMRPLHPRLACARLEAALDRERLRVRAARLTGDLASERERVELMSSSSLPYVGIAGAGAGAGPPRPARMHDPVTLVYVELTGSEELWSKLPPDQAVSTVERVFSVIADLSRQRAVTVVKTFGESFLAAAGAPEPIDDPADAGVRLALDIQHQAGKLLAALPSPPKLRIGVASGAVVGATLARFGAGFEVWGEPLRTAVFLADTAPPGAIQADEETRRALRGQLLCEDRGAFYVEGRGEVRTFIVTGAA